MRSDGQHRLYRKLIRRMAEFGVANGSELPLDKLLNEIHKDFKTLYADGKSTTKMSVQEMHVYYEACERHSILILGLLWRKEDLKEFDHGFTKSE